MRYIKEHIMFIFPMLTILLGIESFMVFDRISKNYEQDLKSNYSMLVLSHQKMNLEKFKKLSHEVSSIDLIEKRGIIDDMAKGIKGISSNDIMNSLPFFYNIHFGKYLNENDINKIRDNFAKSKQIKKVETFNQNHNSNYRLFIFIKIIIWVFVGFMVLSSLFLVVKQMEIWHLSHIDRMQIMEIFGASNMLRSGILFKVAIIDAIVATILAILAFLFLRFVWASQSGISIITHKKELLFEYIDIAILFGISIVIVIVAVSLVSAGAKEERL